MKVFVHKYKWSHDRRRRMLRRKAAKGECEVFARTHDGTVYLITDPSLPWAKELAKRPIK
jgi:hypothetical protein